MKNNKRKGQYRFFIFMEPDTDEYTGICIELALVKVHKDPDRLKEDLINAAKGYVEVVVEDELPDKLLNQKQNLPKKYLRLFEEYADLVQKGSNKELTRTTRKVFEHPATATFVRPAREFALA